MDEYPWLEKILAVVLMYIRNKVDVEPMARVRNKLDVVPMARKDSSCGPYVHKEQSGRSTHGSKRF